MNIHQKFELLISLAGVLFLIGGILKICKRAILIRKGIKVEGVIVHSEKVLRENKTLSFQYYPVVKYLTLENKSITQKYNTGTPFKFYNEGEKAIIYYDKTDNSRYVIDNTLTKYTGLLFIFIGLCFCYIGIHMYLMP